MGTEGWQPVQARPQTQDHQLPSSWGTRSARLMEAWLQAKVETAFNPRGAQGSVGKVAGSPIPCALQACEGMQPGLQGWTRPELLCSDLRPDSEQLQGGFPPHKCVPMQEVWEHSGAGPGQGDGRPETRRRVLTPCVSPTGHQGHPAQVGASASPQGGGSRVQVGPLQG